MSDIIIRGIHKAIVNMGGKIVKCDSEFVYLDIIKNSELDDETAILRLKEAIAHQFSLGLKIRIISL